MLPASNYKFQPEQRAFDFDYGITADGPQGVVTGYVSDRIGVAELQIDGRIVPVDSGGYAAETFVPIGGTVATLTASTRPDCRQPCRLLDVLTTGRRRFHLNNSTR